MASGGTMDGMEGARRGPHPLALAYFALFAILIVLGVLIALLGNPHAGDSVVAIDIKPVAVAKPQPAAPLSATSRTPAAYAGEIGVGVFALQILATPSIPKTVTQSVYAGRSLVADPALIENTPDGPLPRIADDGTTPMRAYAAPSPADGHPRIAIVIAGLGFSAKATAQALAALPSGVTLAFVPYAGDVQHWVSAARQQGHEVLLEVPMEPYDFPDSDPGPHTLRSGVGEDANTQRLVWALTRFSGYTGVTNLLGGRFLSDAASLEPVMTYVTRRGLLFYDNGSATHSAAPDVASRIGAPFAQATSTIDTIQTAMEIDRRLSDLETEARAHGSASGAGILLPITLQRVTQWAQGLNGRGFVLAPASAIVSQKK
jgi:polysaccharide deacetylase 2 family uncharacterized protein YibQ